MKINVKPSVASAAMLGLSIALTVIAVYSMQKNIEQILKDRLRERLATIAATAELSLDKQQILDGMINYDSVVLESVANKLRNIRSVNKRIKYIYIMLPTRKSNEMKFLVDADTYDPIDWDNNGQIDDIEIPPEPGESYDAIESPMLNVAVNEATADFDLTQDEWGTFLSGYAPIKIRDETMAILGLDMDVSDYMDIVQSTIIPFSLLLGLLALVLIFQTYWLVKIWNSRVQFLSDLDRQKDELLSLVSHQLATPVSSMKWYLEMMQEGDLGKLSKEQKEHVQTMQAIGVNLSDLVSMILDVSRIQLGRVHVDKEELDLQGFFKEILEEVKPKAKEKKMDFNVELPKSFPKAKLDRRYTRMTIENLLTNAIKYTPEGGKVTWKVEVKGNSLYCEVKDTGCGIPEKDQEKIFGRMFRASNVRNEVDGNGFGLYIAKGAVEAQGGKIWFESQEDKGTRFFVELPL